MQFRSEISEKAFDSKREKKREIDSNLDHSTPQDAGETQFPAAEDQSTLAGPKYWPMAQGPLGSAKSVVRMSTVSTMTSCAPAESRCLFNGTDWIHLRITSRCVLCDRAYLLPLSTFFLSSHHDVFQTAADADGVEAQVESAVATANITANVKVDFFYSHTLFEDWSLNIIHSLLQIVPPQSQGCS